MRQTPTFSWTIPGPGTVPYAPAVRSLFHTMDQQLAAVFSAAVAAHPMTMILSAYPTGVTSFVSVAVGSPWLGGEGFRVLSAAPVGLYVGCFALTVVPQVVALDVRGIWGSSAAVGLTSAVDFRAVVNPGSVVVPAHGRWMADQLAFPYIALRLQGALRIDSTGPYSVTFEARAINLGGGETNVRYGPPNYWVALVRELGAP
jgi:hypothetical protein